MMVHRKFRSEAWTTFTAFKRFFFGFCGGSSSSFLAHTHIHTSFARCECLLRSFANAFNSPLVGFTAELGEALVQVRSQQWPFSPHVLILPCNPRTRHIPSKLQNRCTECLLRQVMSVTEVLTLTGFNYLNSFHALPRFDLVLMKNVQDRITHFHQYKIDLRVESSVNSSN
jgi:hypothetical protein